jgi:hypothetical protein
VIAGAMCLVADLAVFAGSVATIFGLSWYEDTKRKRKIRRPIEEEKEEKQLHNKILAEQIA